MDFLIIFIYFKRLIELYQDGDLLVVLNFIKEEERLINLMIII